MPQFDWQPFLQDFSRELLKPTTYRNETGDLTPPPSELIATEWLGYPGTTENQLRQAETRLGVTLPPSYREFLRLTNGWRQASDFVWGLWPVEQIEWLIATQPRWTEGIDDFELLPDEEYLDYSNQNVLRPEYLKTALQISPVGDSAFYVLNPKIVTITGEWEAWFLASWNAAIPARYPSFWDMLHGEYEFLVNPQDD